MLIKLIDNIYVRILVWILKFDTDWLQEGSLTLRERERGVGVGYGGWREGGGDGGQLGFQGKRKNRKSNIISYYWIREAQIDWQKKKKFGIILVIDYIVPKSVIAWEKSICIINGDSNAMRFIIFPSKIKNKEYYKVKI